MNLIVKYSLKTEAVTSQRQYTKLKHNKSLHYSQPLHYSIDSKDDESLIHTGCQKTVTHTAQFALVYKWAPRL